MGTLFIVDIGIKVLFKPNWNEVFVFLSVSILFIVSCFIINGKGISKDNLPLFTKIISSIPSYIETQTFNDSKIDKELKKLEKEIRPQQQYIKIIEIRRNEHFGDILMFLNKRSTLRVKVKSNKAELFYLNKKDALEISISYSLIWKKINKRSLFNWEQIKR
jgi:hypothetical protein